MEQEIEHVNRREVPGQWPGRTSSLLWSRVEDERAHGQTEGTLVHDLDLSNALLSALGDESSRRILNSAVTSGKTVEDISEEQSLPLSTCYRRIRQFVDEGLMLLERMVVTSSGKRYALYRTSFSKATIGFNDGVVAVGITPNADVLEKLRTRWLSANYPTQNQDDRRSSKAKAQPREMEIPSPFF